MNLSRPRSSLGHENDEPWVKTMVISAVPGAAVLRCSIESTGVCIQLIDQHHNE